MTHVETAKIEKRWCRSVSLSISILFFLWAFPLNSQEGLNQGLNINAMVSDKIFIGIVDDERAFREIDFILSSENDKDNPLSEFVVRGIVFTIASELHEGVSVSENIVSIFPSSLQEVIRNTELDHDSCEINSLYLSNGDVFLWASVDSDVIAANDVVYMPSHCVLLSFAYAIGLNSFEISGFSTNELRAHLQREMTNGG
jgi:hypothetical protein